MLTALGAVVTFAEPVLRLISWPARKVWGSFATRPKMRLVVGEVDWSGSHPYGDEFQVSAVLVHLALSNGSPNPNSVSTLRLDVAGKSFPPAQHQVTRAGVPIAVSGGKIVAVPKYNEWLHLPADLKGYGSVSGWVAFITMRDPGGLTFGEARRTQGTNAAIAATGKELHVDIPACSFPAVESR